MSYLYNGNLYSGKTSLHLSGSPGIQEAFITRKMHVNLYLLILCCGWQVYFMTKLIKLPWSGVTLCFQFLSAASAAAATFASHVKIV